MKKVMMIALALITMTVMAGCGEPPKAEISTPTETILEETIITENIIEENVITWDSDNVKRW